MAEPVFRYGQKGVTVPLAPDEIEAVARIASSEGSDLGRRLHDWIVEKLNEVLRTGQPSEAT